ncbi:MAG TPA: peptidoglycan DD-metalloendopeptidase family protein, partial [Candidatus Dormibacteraeota bacterium]|nr:peptidoglycan DD-metalloendopeptidase family protein [Candidatus Dormibacteraeota bacterium]
AFDELAVRVVTPLVRRRGRGAGADVSGWPLGLGAAVASAAVLVAGAGAGTATLSGESLGHLLGDDRHATIVDLDGGGVRVTAPAGTPLLALVGGRARLTASGAIELRGRGSDADITVTYANATAPISDNTVAAGAAVGTVPASGTVDVTLTLEGAELDVGGLIEDSTAGPGGAAGGGFAEASGSAPGTADLPPGTMVRPVVGATVTQGFGCTWFAFEPVDAGCPGGHVHSGIDLAAPLGTPVRAALGGRVHVVRTIGGYGLRVEISNPAGLLTLYGHLLDVSVGDGDAVATGDPIATVGSSGNSTGPHLHFEVRRLGVPEDPRIDVTLP